MPSDWQPTVHGDWLRCGDEQVDATATRTNSGMVSSREGMTLPAMRAKEMSRARRGDEADVNESDWRSHERGGAGGDGGAVSIRQRLVVRRAFRRGLG